MPKKPPFFLFDVRLHLLIVIGLVATWAASEPGAGLPFDNGSSMVAMTPPLGHGDGHDMSSCGCHAYWLPTIDDSP